MTVAPLPNMVNNAASKEFVLVPKDEWDQVGIRDVERGPVKSDTTDTTQLGHSVSRETKPQLNLHLDDQAVLSRQQILGTGNLPQDSAPVCINIDGAPTKPSILRHRS